MALELWGASIKLVTQGEFFLGCGPLEPVSRSTVGELECNLIILKDSEGERTLFISLDALYPGANLRAQLEDGLRDEFNPSQIVLGASHSHNSPMTDETKPALGLINDEFVAQIVRQVTNSVKRLIGTKPAPVGLDVRSFVTSSTVYRRKRSILERSKFGIRLFPVVLLPNPKKRVRPESNILEFRDSDGNVVGSIWVMPCHPVAFPIPGDVSAHYIGEVRRSSREAKDSHSNAPFVFFQGASGDLRPAFFAGSSEQKGIVSLARFFRRTANMLSTSTADYTLWYQKLSQEFAEAPIVESQKIGQEIQLSQARLIRRPLQEFLRREGSQVGGFYDLHLVSVGGVRLAGLSAEPTWLAREALVKDLEPLVIFGCINDTYGYLPSPRQLLEGGYEAGGFMRYFGFQSGIKSRIGLYRIFLHTRKVLKDTALFEQ